MITAFLPAARGMERVAIQPGSRIPSTTLWLDVASPTPAERKAAEDLVGVEIPTPEDMAAIETSERLFEERGVLVMTAVMPMAVREPDPKLSSLTFVLTAKRLVTVRYGDPKSIALTAKRAQTDGTVPHSGPGAMFLHLESIIDRLADEVERASSDYDALCIKVFEGGVSARKSGDYKEAIKSMGLIGLKVAKLHDVCGTLARLLLFLAFHRETVALSAVQVAACKSIGRDVQSIKEHADALDNKLSFLLDATVGLVTLEQNQIIKLFSVLAVIFLPPTLIASIYGMNFDVMPELKWALGYPYSIGVMVLSVVVTFLYFRWQKLL